jgi:16S rRNA (uracil1498-N3)-methyltransferase
MRRFLADPLPSTGEELLLAPDISHHLLRVTGIAPGEEVELFDGRGRAARAALVAAEGGRARVRGLSGPAAEPPRAPLLLLAGLMRQGPFDTLVRMGTELGMTALWPVRCRRSVAHGERADRWERIARSAAAQCGRSDVPVVEAPRSLPAVLSALPPAFPRLVCVPGAPVGLAPAGPLAVLLGPEGGLDDEEVAVAQEAGFRPFGLGDTVLRGDTAAAAALALLLMRA